MKFIDDEFIIVIDDVEPCNLYHLVFDLDQNLLVVHNVRATGRINSGDLIQYKRPTSMKVREYSDDALHYIRQMFADKKGKNNFILK